MALAMAVEFLVGLGMAMVTVTLTRRGDILAFAATSAVATWVASRSEAEDSLVTQPSNVQGP